MKHFGNLFFFGGLFVMMLVPAIMATSAFGWCDQLTIMMWIMTLMTGGALVLDLYVSISEYRAEKARKAKPAKPTTRTRIILNLDENKIEFIEVPNE